MSDSVSWNPVPHQFILVFKSITMKNLREMTDEQAIEIAKLALESIINFDAITTLIHQNNASALSLKVEREVWNPKNGNDPELIKIVVRLEGRGNTWCDIWEVDNENHVDISVVEDAVAEDVSNQVIIVKKLIEWDYV